MVSTISASSPAEAKAQQALQKTAIQAAKKIVADPERRQKFLVKGGFITKSGKLPKYYGG